MNRKRRKAQVAAEVRPPIAAVRLGGQSAGAFLVGLSVVTAVVTPALIALSPYRMSLTTVVLTSPLIVAFHATLLAAGCFLYERYGLKHTQVGWLSIFFTFALPGSIINIVGFAAVATLLPRAATAHNPWATVFVETVVLGFIGALFMQLGFQIIKPSALDERRKAAILLIMWSFMLCQMLGGPYGVRMPAALVGIAFGIWMARALGKRVGPAILFLRSLWPYIQVMLAPTATFVIGYLMIAFLFAGFMGAAYRLDRASFVGVSGEVSFFAFFYYTIGTMTTVGYGDIAPASSLARLLSNAAAVTALCWVTVVFAAVLAFLQPRFARILKETSVE